MCLCVCVGAVQPYSSTIVLLRLWVRLISAVIWSWTDALNKEEEETTTGPRCTCGGGECRAAWADAIADGTPCQVALSDTNGWRKKQRVTMSNISCQIHLNNLSSPAVTDINCRWDGASHPPKNGTCGNSLNKCSRMPKQCGKLIFVVVVVVKKTTYALQRGHDFENAWGERMDDGATWTLPYSAVMSFFQY